MMGLGLRPPRVAVLVPRELTMAAARDLCGCLQETWGGAGFVLSPAGSRFVSLLVGLPLLPSDSDCLVQ